MEKENESAFLSFFQPGKELRDAAIAYASLRPAIFVFPIKPHDKKPPLTPHGYQDATTNLEQIREWWPVGSINNIGIALPQSGIVVIDTDPRHGGDKSFAALVEKYGPLPDTYTVKSGGGGFHYYFRVPADFYDSASYPKEIADGIDLKIRGYVVAPPSEVEGNQYSTVSGDPEAFAPFPFTWVDNAIREKLQQFNESYWNPEDDNFRIPDGQRNNALAALFGHLHNLGFSQSDLIETGKIIVENHFDGDINETLSQLSGTARSISSQPRHGIAFYNTRVALRKTTHKPILDTVALHGPIGDFVTLTLPHTEAHPAALLVQALVIFGNQIGNILHGDPAPGFTVEDTRHKTGLYTLIIGASAVAGKGDSWNRARRFVEPIDTEWRFVTGVQTGEGLIKYLADTVATGEKAKINGEEVELMRKGGSTDRRLLVFEPEFGRVIHTGSRLGATIRDIYKSIWDSGSTQNITAAQNVTMTDVIVSFIGHVTKHELEDTMPSTDFYNGFLNRFILVYVERSKSLPKAKPLPERKLKYMRHPLENALEFAREEAPDNYDFSPEADELWSEIGEKWKKISEREEDPVVQALLGRSRANIWRLAIVYAVSCENAQIEVEDLLAAQAVWQYHYESCQFIFGGYIGDKDANKIYRALIASPIGLSDSEIWKVLGRGFSQQKKERALNLLKERGLVVESKEKRSPGARKSSRVYRATQLPSD